MDSDDEVEFLGVFPRLIPDLTDKTLFSVKRIKLESDDQPALVLSDIIPLDKYPALCTPAFDFAVDWDDAGLASNRWNTNIALRDGRVRSGGISEANFPCAPSTSRCSNRYNLSVVLQLDLSGLICSPCLISF